MKMVDIDIDPFGEHDKMDGQPDETGKTIPFTLGGLFEGSIWEPQCKQETLFRGGKTQSTRLKEVCVER